MGSLKVFDGSEYKPVGVTINQNITNYVQPRNLLDNSNFANPVNQNGQSSYTSSGISIDRWKRVVNITVDVEDGYVRISAPETGDDYQSFYQYINPEYMAADKKYTLAIQTISGDIYSIMVIAPALAEGQTATVYTEQREVEDLGFFSLGLDTDGLYQFRIRAYKGKSLSLVWAALYEGEFTAETLPKYQPKSFAAELTECLWYRFVVSGNTSLYGYTNASGVVRAVMPLLAPMRLKNPTVTMSGTFQLYAAGTSHINFEVSGTPTIYGNALRLTLTRDSTTEVPAKEPIAVVSPSTAWVIDAELK